LDKNQPLKVRKNTKERFDELTSVVKNSQTASKEILDAAFEAVLCFLVIFT